MGRFLTLLAMLAALTYVAAQDQDNRQPPDPNQQRGTEPEILTRGPIHEAFAVSISLEAKPGLTIRKAPPEAIEELPPDQKPEGEDVQWIPGYWFWDDDRNDFIWISGAWRVPPANHQWVPGAWHEVNGQYQWTSGFWISVETKKVEYLPPPPPEPENAPATRSPGEGYVYCPGIWVYQDGRYMWRPGHWVAPQEGWVFIPAHYVWSPAGVVFVDSYWDYPLENRGLLFAPVYLTHAVYAQPNYVYRPSYVIYDTALLGALFVRPGYSTYYFGDYFDRRYSTLGYRSWIDYRYGTAYDPLWSYYRHSYVAHDRNWVNNMTALYQGRMRGEIPRPALTYADQNTVITRGGNNNYSGYLSLAAPLQSVDTNLVRLSQVNRVDQQEAAASVRSYRQFANQRVQAETQSRGAGEGRTSQPATLDLSRSPIRSGGRGAATQQPDSDPRVTTPQPPSRGKADDPASKTTPRRTDPDTPNTTPAPSGKTDPRTPRSPSSGKVDPPNTTPPSTGKSEPPGRPSTPPPPSGRPDPRPTTPGQADPPTRPTTPPPGAGKSDPRPATPPPGTGKTDPRPTTPPATGKTDTPPRPAGPPPRPPVQQPKGPPERPKTPPVQDPRGKGTPPSSKEKEKNPPPRN